MHSLVSDRKCPLRIYPSRVLGSGLTGEQNQRAQGHSSAGALGMVLPQLNIPSLETHSLTRLLELCPPERIFYVPKVADKTR